MPAELLRAARSLATLIEEENALLAAPARVDTLAPLVEAKSRLTGIVERESVRLTDAARRDAMTPAMRDELGAALKTLIERMGVNATLLRRRMELCDDLMGAITAEARRASGAQSRTYGARGGLAVRRDAAPIAINSRL